MILDGYAAYLLAKQKAFDTGKRHDIYETEDGFAIIECGESDNIVCQKMHIIRIEPTHRIMRREEYMKWL